MTAASRLWDDFSFVASSRYREKVLTALSARPKLPKQLAQETSLRLGHVSRSLRELSGHGLVECLTPQTKARGRVYGVTDAGTDLMKFLGDSSRRFLPSPETAGFVPKIRGSSVLWFLGNLKRAKGEAAVAEALGAWSGNRHELTEDRWLSVDACAELLDLVETKFGDGSYQFIRSLFAQASPSFPSIREELLRALPLEALAERAPIVYGKEWNFGRLEVTTSKRRAIFAHFDWMPTAAMCAMFHGVYEGVLRRRGFEGKVTKTRCVRRGDDRCEYVVEW